MLGLVRAALCGLVIMAPGIAPAATLTATFASDFLPFGFAGAAGGETAFVIDFDDSLGSTAGVLEGVEFNSFTWINNPFTFGGDQFRTLLAVAPSISGLIEGFVVPSTTNPFSLQNVNWVFREAPASSTGSAVAATAFTYAITLPPPPPPVAPVPLPAAGWMLLACMGGLAALRRRV